jgi:hypothetical protein
MNQAAALQALQALQAQGRNCVPPSNGAQFPEFSFFSQFAPMFPPDMTALAAAQQQLGYQVAVPNTRTRSNDSGKSSQNYATRHSAAEQRRRTRINERFAQHRLCLSCACRLVVHGWMPRPFRATRLLVSHFISGFSGGAGISLEHCAL